MYGRYGRITVVRYLFQHSFMVEGFSAGVLGKSLATIFDLISTHALISSQRVCFEL